MRIFLLGSDTEQKKHLALHAHNVTGMRVVDYDQAALERLFRPLDSEAQWWSAFTSLMTELNQDGFISVTGLSIIAAASIYINSAWKFYRNDLMTQHIQLMREKKTLIFLVKAYTVTWLMLMVDGAIKNLLEINDLKYIHLSGGVQHCQKTMDRSLALLMEQAK